MVKLSICSIKDISILLVALTFAPLFLYWTWSVFLNLDYGDNLFEEKILLFGVLLIHVAIWVWPLRPNFTLAKTTLAVLSLLMATVGFLLSKNSVFAISFVLFICSCAALSTDRRDYRSLTIMIGCMAVLLWPSWMLALPGDLTMQSITAAISYKLVHWLYPSAVLHGFVIAIEGFHVTIAESCGGGSFLRLNLAVAVYCSMYSKHWRVIGFRLLIAATLAVGLNWVRILVLAVLGRWGYQEFAFHSGHAFIGHVTFVCGMAPIIWHSALPEKWNEFADHVAFFALRLKRDAVARIRSS